MTHTRHTDRDSLASLCARPFYFEAIFSERSHLFTPPTAPNCHFRLQAWESQVSMCTVLKCTLNHHISWAIGPKTLTAMLKLPMTHWQRGKKTTVIKCLEINKHFWHDLILRLIPYKPHLNYAILLPTRKVGKEIDFLLHKVSMSAVVKPNQEEDLFCLVAISK